MKESYPYIVLPQKVEKIKLDGIPLPPLPQLLQLPEKVKRKYLGTIIFGISLSVFIVLNVISQRAYIYYMFIAFFISLISLVASIFEFVQYGKLNKQYILDLKLYNENKEAFKKIKANQEKIIQNNKDEKLVKKYQLEKTIEFFKNSYDTINVIHNEYSLAKKRYKLFLEEYFPDEVLDNVRVIHSAKNLEYIPDFIIKFAEPKLNVAIEIEEPYSLSNVPENIQKDYDAKDRIRQRFANELGWIVIVMSEEQAVKFPIECCRFVEESVESIFGDIKLSEQFAKIQPIKQQKMLTGEERAHMKTTGYREKYLTEAGLLDDPEKKIDKYDGSSNEKEKKVINQIIKEHSINNKTDNVDIPESKYPIEDMKTPEEKKETVENEQLMLIKKLAQKVKPENGKEIEKKVEKEAIKFKSENGKQIEDEEKEISKIDKVEEKAIINQAKIEEKEVVSDLKLETEVIANDNKVVEDESISHVKVEKKALTDNEKIEKKEPINSEKIEKKETGNKLISEKTENDKEELSIKEAISDLSKKEEKTKTDDDVLKDLYDALERHSKKQQERKEKKLKGGIEIKEETENKDESLNNQTEKSEYKNKEDQKIEEITSSLIEDLKEKNDLEEKELEQEEVTIDQSLKTTEPIEQKTELEETKIQESEKELVLKEENAEEMESKRLLQERLKTEKLENEEAEKNQKFIEEYREKIEGAVFDKSWDELIELCNEAIKIVPFWDWPYYRRSTAWGNKKEFEKVIEDCNKAVGFNPSLADAFYNRGTARFFTGKYRESADDYQKAIDLNCVKKAEAYFNKALCFQKLDLHKKAYLEFMKAKEMGSRKAEEILKSQYE